MEGFPSVEIRGDILLYVDFYFVYKIFQVVCYYFSTIYYREEKEKGLGGKNPLRSRSGIF